MDFFSAVKAGFANWLNVQGRALRSEYWWWALFSFIVMFVASVADVAVFGSSFGSGYAMVDADGTMQMSDSTSLFTLISSLVLLIPSITVAIRRLHDIDKSGWWYLITLIPIVGVIVFIVFAVRPGTAGPNRFGLPR